MSSQGSSTKPRTGRKPAEDLKGRRILVVEDSPVVAPFTADLLTELGCEVIGPAPNLAAARELIEDGEFDAALMDVHIRGERVFPLLDLLQARRTPFVLTSGYADWQMPDKWRDATRLQKPYTLDQVGKALGTALGARPDLAQPQKSDTSR
jgi:DNA-binding NtrC family response regulator